MVAHFPQYNWFDPMTGYPFGKIIDWGPFYPFLSAALCLLFGASSRTDIVYCAGWVTPLFTAMMVPIAYKLGTLIWDWKAGLFSAGLISVFSYQYFVISTYGFVSHHIAEVVFSALFILAYLYALDTTKKAPITWSNPKTLSTPLIFSCLAGILFFLGFVTSPTVQLVLFVIGISTCIQYILNYAEGRHSGYLLFTNTLTFLSVAILITLFGFHNAGLSMTTYTPGPVIVVLGLIAESVVFYGLSQLFSKNRMHYLLSLLGIFCGGCILVMIVPAFQTIWNQVITLTWSDSAYSFVVETQPWSLSAAYEAFGLMLILMAGGLLILTGYLIRKRDDAHLFLLVWFVAMLILTLPHQRFQLYLTVPAALLAGIFISESLRWAGESPRRASILPGFLPRHGQGTAGNGPEETAGKTRKVKKDSNKPPVQWFTSFRRIIPVGITILVLLAVAGSVIQDVTYVAATPSHGLAKDWIETLGWLKDSTPSPMINNFQNYDSLTFTYPNESYGVMAPWAVGHEITFISQRLPITNPFQDNLAGPDGAAAYYLSQNESAADSILTRLKGRYVITDLQTATDTFPSLTPWTGSPLSDLPYIVWFFSRDATNPSGFTKTHRLGDPYFQSQIIRLQMFDGSMVLPGTGQYIQYTIQKAPASEDTADTSGLVRVITGLQMVNISQDVAGISPERGETLVSGVSYADIFSTLPYQPVNKVPALTHYRLVHESPTNISTLLGGPSTATLPDIRSVKVFEFVKGARIPGEGVIELTVVTNTGRSFVYRQESTGGEFVVPYATEGATSEVRAAGPYHIVGTARYIPVTEDDVLSGSTVSVNG